MAQKKVKTRIQQKHDIEVNWNTASMNGFVPLNGELIIYDSEFNSTTGQYTEKPSDREHYICYERFKIGDGYTKVSALPFQPHPFVAAVDSAYANDLSIGIGGPAFGYYKHVDSRFFSDPIESARYLEFFDFDLAPVGYTRTDYVKIDRSWSSVQEFTYYFYFNSSTLPDGFNIFIKPSKSLTSNWTIATTASDTEMNTSINSSSDCSSAVFMVSLPNDRHSSEDSFKYNIGIAKLKITKLSRNHILIEPDVFVQ